MLEKKRYERKYLKEILIKLNRKKCEIIVITSTTYLPAEVVTSGAGKENVSIKYLKK